MEIDFSEYLDLTSEFTPLLREDSIASTIRDYRAGLDFENFDIGILFVPNADKPSNEKFSLAHGEFLDYLNALYKGSFNCRIVNLGTLIPGQTEADTLAALTMIIDFLVSRRITPFIITGNRTANYAAYSFFKGAEQVASITAIDSILNIGCDNENSYLAKIVKEQPNFLFNYSNLGYQTYLVSDGEIALADELYFDVTRLGELRENVRITEPVIRSAEILTASLECLKHSEFKSVPCPQPNGFYSEDLCQMMRYSGLSERLKVMLLTDYYPLPDAPADVAFLGQLFWCFLDGFYNRKPEIPHQKNESFLKYRVALREDEFHLTFYKSLKTDRWWMEVPIPPHYDQKYRKHQLIPCSYEDYLMATNDELPDRWWKAYKKML